MERFKSKFAFLWALLVCLIGLINQSASCGVIVTVLPQMVDLTATNYYINIFALSYIDAEGQSPVLSGPLLSITNAGEYVPFVSLSPAPSPATNSGSVYYPSELYGFNTLIATDVLYETYRLTWTNYSADIKVDFNPFFLVQPQGQFVFVGSNVVFTAQALHTTGYQWQKDGENLVEDGHFIGVTHATLTISNAQITDAGDYTLIANHPDNPTTSFDAVLGVFKPIQVALTQSPSDGGHQLQVGNQDGSPVDDNQVAHFTIYTTTDLSLDISGWDVESTTGMLTNGICLIPLPDDGSPARQPK